MSEMVERVARAMFETNPGRNKALLWTHAACPRARYRTQARAAIKAMREPTDEQRNEFFRRFGEIMFDATWEKMIDCALKETTE